MKLLRNTILLFFLSFSSYIGAQFQYEMKCTMTERQIMQSQSFNEDAPESEFALPVVKILLFEFEEFYTNLNNGDMQAASENKVRINEAIQNANALQLNYSMFEDDIEFLQQYNLGL